MKIKNFLCKFVKIMNAKDKKKALEKEKKAREKALKSGKLIKKAYGDTKF